MLDRVGLPPGEALAAGEVVEQRRVPRVRRGQVPSLIGRFGVAPLLVEPASRGPELPSGWPVHAARRAPHGQDRRLRLLGERRSLHAWPGKDERSGWRVEAFAVEL